MSSLVLFYILLPFCFPRTSPDDYGPAAKRFFSALRYASPGDGYSPFLPLFFSSLAIVAWAASYVRRMGFLQATIPVVSAPPGDAASATSYLGLDSNSLHDVVYRETRVRRALSNPFSMPLARLLLLLFVFAGLGYCFFRYESDTAGFGLFRTVEGRTFDDLFMLLFLIGYCVTALNFLRFVGGWIELRRLLRRLSWHPLRESCAELGAPAGGSSTGEAESDHRVRNLPSLSLGSPVPTFTALEYSVELAGVVARNTQTLTTTKVSSETAPSLIKIVRDKAPELEAGLRNAKAELAEGLEADADGDSLGKRSARLSIQSALADMSHNLAAALDSDWQPAADTPREGGESVEDRWRRSAGLFLASRVLNYSALVLSHLRNLLAFSIIGFLLMLMAGSSYPFPRSDTILRFGWMMLLAAVVTAISIFFQMNRDRTLSLLSGGTPGKIDWNGAFVGHLALYGVLPIVTILGIRFPATFSGVINAVASLLPGAGHP